MVFLIVGEGILCEEAQEMMLDTTAREVDDPTEIDQLVWERCDVEWLQFTTLEHDDIRH